MADPLCVLRALAALLDRRDGTAAGCIVARYKVHTGLGCGEPALGVRQNGLDIALFVLSAGARMGPALLSARRHGGTQRTTDEGHSHGANAVLRIPCGRRPWPPGPYLHPNWCRRGRLFPPLGREGLGFLHPHSRLMHTSGLTWPSSMCGVQGMWVCAQTVESCLQERAKSPRDGTVDCSRSAVAAIEARLGPFLGRFQSHDLRVAHVVGGACTNPMHRT